MILYRYGLQPHLFRDHLADLFFHLIRLDFVRIGLMHQSLHLIQSFSNLYLVSFKYFRIRPILDA